MNNWKLIHVVQGFQYLHTEPLSKRHWEALEIIILDKLVKIYWQHFEIYANVGSVCEIVFDSYNIFAIFMVRISQCF